jgi:hypothetical protein
VKTINKSSADSKAAMRYASKQKAANWALNHLISKCDNSNCGGIDADSHADTKIERKHDVQLQQEKEKYYNSLVQMLEKE